MASLAFPGTIFDARGRSPDGDTFDLQKEMDTHPHASHVSLQGDGSAVACVWVLDDDATPRGIPAAVMGEAVRLVLAGKGVLILARRPEVEVHVREGLLRALDLATVPECEGGRA